MEQGRHMETAAMASAVQAAARTATIIMVDVAAPAVGHTVHIRRCRPLRRRPRRRRRRHLCQRAHHRLRRPHLARRRCHHRRRRPRRLRPRPRRRRPRAPQRRACRHRRRRHRLPAFWRSEAFTRAHTGRPTRSSGAGALTTTASSATARRPLAPPRPRSTSGAPSVCWRPDGYTRART